MTQYDDLVYVKWQYPRVKLKKKNFNYPSVVRKKRFKAELVNVGFDGRRGLHYVDFQIVNLSKKNLKVGNKNIWITRNNKVLPVLEKVYSKKELSFGEALKYRLILRLKKQKGFTTHFKFRKYHLKLIVKRRYL